MRNRYDVIVIGLGAMGSCALATLAARGLRVLGVDRFDPPHDRGSSHGGSRVIRLSYFEHSDYVPLLRRAYEGFDRISRDAGVTLRYETGLVAGGAPGNVVAAGMLRSAREHGLDVEAIDGRELSRRYPQFRAPADWEVVCEKQGGFVRPEATIRAALSLGVRAGAEIARNAPLVDWTADDAGVRVDFSDRRANADAMVLATGAWMPQALGLAAPRLRPTRETIVWVDDEGDPAWQCDAMPVWLFDRGSEPAVYGVPAFPGMGLQRGLKVGLHGRGPDVRPEEIDAPISRDIVDESVRAAAEHVVSLTGRKVVAAKHCLYTNSLDGDFVVGLHPAHGNVAMACGFSGHGFKFAPVIGEALADLATTGKTALPIGFLSPARFG